MNGPPGAQQHFQQADAVRRAAGAGHRQDKIGGSHGKKTAFAACGLANQRYAASGEQWSTRRLHPVQSGPGVRDQWMTLVSGHLLIILRRGLGVSRLLVRLAELVECVGAAAGTLPELLQTVDRQVRTAQLVEI